MEVLPVVQHLHSLAINPRNRSGIVKDQGCLPGLVLFLDNEDVQVVLTALKTLHLLAMHGPNKVLMKEEIGMIPSLQLLMSKSDPDIKKFATDTYSMLMGSKPVSGSTNYFGKSNSRAKIITLQVRGLHQATRKICEEQLLQVKGVISFTFSMAKARCTVRVKPDVDAKQLCNKINDTKIMSAQQIVKNDSGDEVVLAFGKCPVPASAKEKQDKMPDYLPEDEESVPISNKVLVKTEQNKENGGGGWFSGVSNFISSTLYW